MEKTEYIYLKVIIIYEVNQETFETELDIKFVPKNRTGNPYSISV
jgi:hypothetical protein